MTLTEKRARQLAQELFQELHQMELPMTDSQIAKNKQSIEKIRIAAKEIVDRRTTVPSSG